MFSPINIFCLCYLSFFFVILLMSLLYFFPIEIISNESNQENYHFNKFQFSKYPCSTCKEPATHRGHTSGLPRYKHLPSLWRVCVCVCVCVWVIKIHCLINSERDRKRRRDGFGLLTSLSISLKPWCFCSLRRFNCDYETLCGSFLLRCISGPQGSLPHTCHKQSSSVHKRLLL